MKIINVRVFFRRRSNRESTISRHKYGFLFFFINLLFWSFVTFTFTFALINDPYIYNCLHIKSMFAIKNAIIDKSERKRERERGQKRKSMFAM